jgi:cytochrome P450
MRNLFWQLHNQGDDMSLPRKRKDGDKNETKDVTRLPRQIKSDDVNETKDVARLPKKNSCTAESTRIVLNTLSRFFYGNKKPFAHLPHHPGYTTADLFFGEEADKGTAFSDLVAAMTRLAVADKSHKCSTYLGPSRVILIYHPHDIKQVLEENKDNLNTQESVAIFSHHFEDAVMSHPTTSDRWKTSLRRIREPVGSLKNNPALIIDLAQEYVKKLEGLNSFNLKQVANGYTIDIILKGFLEHKTEVPLEEKEKLADMISAGIDEVAKLSNVAWLTVEEKLPFKRKLKFKSDALLKEGEEFIKKILDKDSEFKSEETINNIAFLLVAGSETTTQHFICTFLRVLENPEILKKVRKEVDELGDPKDWTVETFTPDKTSYTRSVILESLRLHPPLPYRKIKVGNGFMITNADETEFTEFKKDDHIIIHTHATHLSQDIYENPETFRPERFDGKNFDKLLSPSGQFTLQPFGMGERSCPGQRLAWLEVMIALVSFVRAFDMTLEHVWDSNKTITFSARPEHIPFVNFTPRKSQPKDMSSVEYTLQKMQM